MLNLYANGGLGGPLGTSSKLLERSVLTDLRSLSRARALDSLRIGTMLRLNNIKIPVRIAIACLVPMLAFVAFALKDIVEKHSVYSTADRIVAIANTAPKISGLIHELQKERGATAGFVNSKGAAFAEALPAQRALTDKATADWRQTMDALNPSVLSAKFKADLDSVRSAFDALNDTRTSADRFSTTAQSTSSYYTGAIAHLVSMIESISAMSDDARIMRASAALSSTLKRKEFAGQERATGVVGFTKGEFAPDVHRNFIRLSAMQDAQLAAFENSATPAETEFAGQALQAAGMDELARMRTAGAESPFKGNVGGVSAAQWFDATTKYIDALRPVEARLSDDLVTAVRGVANEARLSFWGILTLFAAMLAAAAGLSVFVALSITRPVGQLVGAMGILAGGDTSIEVPGTDRGDEIGTMAQAVLVFRDAAIEKTRLETENAERERREAAEKAERERRAMEEKAEADRRAAAEREAAAAKVMNEFDAAVGGIVKAAMAGDFSQRVPLDGKDGVIRNLAESMNTMCDNVGKVFEDLVRMLGALAQGDLTSRITAEYQGAFASLKDNANTTAQRLLETIAEIKAAAKEVANAALEISGATTDLSQRTEEQAASLEETSASMEQISATVKKNAENAQHASQSTTATRDVGSRGGTVVAQAVDAMSRIEESSGKIADIIGVIDEIAHQTNLLALNAAVEAARAGDAGRGFAVVAAEVRNLAQRSSEAAKTIKDLITNSSAQVKDGVDLVSRAGTALKEIVASIETVADIVAEIAHASAEQAAGIEQVNKALTQMDEVTQQNSALVEENAATAKTLEHQASQMDERVSYFRSDTDKIVPIKPPAEASKSGKSKPGDRRVA
jgi:methyl-accepting chemotaxis protein